MSALDMLRQRNGFKTTKTVLNKQKSGKDAAAKVAAAQYPTFTESQLNAISQKIDAENAALPATAGNTEMTAAKEKTIQRANQTAQIGGVDINYNASKRDAEDAAPASNTQAQSATIQAPQRKTYADIFRELNPEQVETPDEQKRREKRELNRRRIAAIADGLRALSNVYFSTKGARVIHDPTKDLSAAYLQRQKIADDERQKNRSVWLAGYQKAMALDEEARKNDNTLAEQVRYHNMLRDKYDKTSKQQEKKIEQSQQRIDLSKLKYKSDADYKESIAKIRQAAINGQLEHWQAQDAITKIREQRIRDKAITSAGGSKNTTAGYWYEYYDMMDTPGGKKKINDFLKKRRDIDKVTNTNIRYIMDAVKGRKHGAAPDTKKESNKTAAKKTQNKKNIAKDNFASGLSLK